MINPQITIPRKISGYRSRVINGLIDCLENTRRALAKLNKPEFVITEDLNFRVDLYSSTSVRVHGGRWSRRSIWQQTTMLLTTDSGTSGDFADVKTITGITASGWIILTLNDSDTPTTLTASWTADYPVSDYFSMVQVIAKVTCVSSVITKVEQLHLGDIQDNVAVADSLSLNFASDGQWQIGGWATAAGGVAPASADLFPYKDDTDGSVLYAGPADLADFIEAELDVDAQVDAWIDANFETWALANHSHANHTNLVAPADDHTQYWIKGGASTRNYGASIGDTDGNREVIDLENLELDGGNWSVATGHDFTIVSGTFTITAGSIVVTDGDITAAAGTISADTLEATVGSVKSNLGYYHGLIGPFVSMYLSDASETTKILGCNS